MRYRWQVTSGKTSGTRWSAWAFKQTGGGPCMVVDLGHGSCFVGFSTDNAVEFGLGGQEPPAGGVFDVSGYTTPDVYRVRIDIVGRAPLYVETVGVDGWSVRCFAAVLPGRLNDVNVRGVVGLGADGKEVRRPLTAPSDAATIRGVVLDEQGAPVAGAVMATKDRPGSDTR
ncbi:MAG: hypothetical protein ABR548_06945 [Actinomycetota bacterium]|nr:hypothetical protein [Actinomycetota bacterium]